MSLQSAFTHHRAPALAAVLCSLVALLSITSCKRRPQVASSIAAPTPLNVVLITLDTVRADHLHCYGYQHIQTPVIDGLAHRGVLMETAVAQTPLTQPSHASMFTGTNPNVNGVRNNGGFALQPSSVTLATILRNHGWNTAGFVSATVLETMFGFNQGFNTYDDQMTSGKNANGIVSRPAGATVDRAITWLQAQPQNHPFLLWVHLFDAHKPYDVPAPWLHQYPQNPYDAAIAYEDQQLGRLFRAVDRASPADRTLIVLLSDHGESLGDHGEYEHGIFLYDSTIRIAWIMAGPGVPSGTRIHQQAREIDLLPTILDLLHIAPPAVAQGTSMVPAFSGRPVPTTDSYEETICPKINMGWAELRGLRTPHWMYVQAPRPELYDLDRDPAETHNVITQYPKEYRQLYASLKTLIGTGNGTAETIVPQPLDTSTMQQLKSLGYVSDFSPRKIELSGVGDDPKDHLATLKTLEEISNTHDITASREIEMLQTAIRSDPANPTLYTWLVDADERQGSFQQAIQACLDALHRGIRTGDLLSHLAGLYLRQGDRQQAITYYRQATEVDPLDIDSQNNLATAYLQSGRADEASRAFHRSLAIQPTAAAWNGLGILADRQHQAARSRKYFQRAIQLDPLDIDSQLNLGIVCTQTDDFVCAKQAFSMFLAHVPAGQYKDMVPRVKLALARMNQ